MGRRVDERVYDHAQPRGTEDAGHTSASGVTATAVTLSWALGALAPLARIASHGTAGTTAAVILGVLTIALAIAIAAAPLNERWVVVSTATIVLIAELLTVDLVGRAPALVATAGVIVAAFSLGTARPDPTWQSMSWAGALFAAVGTIGWAATSSPLWLAALIVSVGVAVFTHRRRPTHSSQVLEVRALADLLGRRRDLVAVAVIAGALAAPLFYRLASDASAVVRGVNDFDDHYERVTPLEWSPFRLTAPHPLFHVATKWLEIVTGSAIAMTAIIVVAIAAMAATLVLIARSDWFGWTPLRHGWGYLLPTLFLLGASPAVLLSTGDAWWDRAGGFDAAGRGAGFFPLQVWGSPTLTLAMAMYVPLVPLVLRFLEEPTDRRRGMQVLVLTVAVTLTSPSGVLGLAPGLAILLLIRHRRGDAGPSLLVSARAAAWLIVPSGLVVAWQIWFLATSQSPLEETTWRFNPFWMVEYFEMDRPAFWSLLLLPLAGVVVAGRRFFADQAIQWCGLGFVVSLLPTFLLQETGWKSTHGGLAMTTFVCASLVSAFTIRLLLAELQDVWRHRLTSPPRVAHCVAAFVLLLVAAAGAIDYLTAIGALDRA